MSPEERKDFLRDVAAAVDRAVEERMRPLTKRVETLENTDRRHDTQHRDHQAEIRKSHSESVKTSNDAILAAARYMSGVADAMQKGQVAFQTEMREEQAALRNEIVPRAVGAEAAAVAGAIAAVKTEGKVASVVVDSEATQRDARSAKRWAKLAPLIGTIVQAILAAILAAMQHQ